MTAKEKARIILALSAAVMVTSAGGLAFADPEPGRFALLVGSNLGDRGEAILHHAEDDAIRMAQTLRLLGEFPADQVVLMTGATAPEMRDALIRLNARVREHSNGVLVVFYSGHADEHALHLSGTRLATAELKNLLVGSPAASRLLIVDACRSGSLIQLKGAHPAPAFVVPAFMEPVPEGFAVLTSSAAFEDSQESAALGSSYFTYYVNSGLIGAADQDHDGAVTLSELYAFASSETRAATANSVAGTQNPTFQFALGGRHDLVLTRPARRDVRLGTLRFGQAGRYLVQRREVAGLSPPVAEVAARDPGAELALQPGAYRVTLRGERDISQRDVVVAGGLVTEVDLAQMVRVDVGRIVRKGGLRRSASGFTVALGWHSAELGGGTLALGSGPNFLASLRHDRKWFSAEARLGLDRGTVTDARGIDFDNRGVTPSGLALLPFDWSAVTFAVGLEAGVVFMHQALEVSPQHSQILAAPVTAALLQPHWTTGFEYGPIAQIDSPLGAHSYLRIESGVLWRSFSGDDPNQIIEVRICDFSPDSAPPFDTENTDMSKLAFSHRILAPLFVCMAAGSGCGGGTLDQPTSLEPAMNLQIRFAEPVPGVITEVAAWLSPIPYCPAGYFSSAGHRPLIPTGVGAEWRPFDGSAATMQLPVAAGSYFAGLGCSFDAIPLVRFFQPMVSFGPGQPGLEVPYEWMSHDIIAYTEEAIDFIPFGPSDQPIVLAPGYSVLRRTCGSSDESWRVQLGAPDEPIDVYPAAPQYQLPTGPSHLLEQNERALLEGCGIRPPLRDLGRRVSFDRAASVAFSANSDQLVFLLPIDPGDPAEGAALRSANLSDGSVRELAIVPGGADLQTGATGDVYVSTSTDLVRFVPQPDGTTVAKSLPFPDGRVSPDGRWIAYWEAIPEPAPGTFVVGLKVWDVAAGGGHAIDDSTRYTNRTWTPGSLLEEQGGGGEQPGVTYTLVEPASGHVVDTVSFQTAASIGLAWGSDGPVGLVIPSYWTAEEQVSDSTAALDRVANMREQNIRQAGLILRDPRSGGALNVLDPNAGSLTRAATTTGTALFWARRCLGLFETICSFNLHRVTLPGGDDQVVAVADSAGPVAISPSGDRIAIAARDGVYVRDLP